MTFAIAFKKMDDTNVIYLCSGRPNSTDDARRALLDQLPAAFRDNGEDPSRMMGFIVASDRQARSRRIGWDQYGAKVLPCLYRP